MQERSEAAMPPDLDLTGNANNTQSGILADSETIPDAHVGGVNRALARKRGKPWPRRKNALNVLSRRRSTCCAALNDLDGKAPGYLGPHGPQFSGLHLVGHRNATTLISLNPLLQGGVVEVAKATEHVGERRLLSLRRTQSIFVGQQHLATLLGRDVVADGLVAHVSDRPGVVAATPQGRQTAAQRRKLLPQVVRRAPLDAVDNLGDAQDRISLKKQVHVVRHNFERARSCRGLVPLVGSVPSIAWRRHRPAPRADTWGTKRGDT